jgi:hypothetical protein
MTEWTVTVAVPDHRDTPEQLIELAERLGDFDASAARRPQHSVVVFHLYVTAGDPLKATSVGYDAVVERVGRTPVEIETLTEVEYQRRASEPTKPELMSAAEIADELGVSRQRVHKLRSMATFPLPLAELRGGAVWDAVAVRKFAESWKRKPGRPRARSGVVGVGT